MSEQLKFVVSELNKSPFDKNYNLISFDGLSGELLLQNLSDVLAEVDSKNRLDIREEEPAATALRILGMLRVLKYKPPDEISQGFRQGLVDGNKQVFRKPKRITTTISPISMKIRHNSPPYHTLRMLALQSQFSKSSRSFIQFWNGC